MVRCPRCGDTVDHLEEMPGESLRRESTGSADESANPTGAHGKPSGRVCHWCRHELLEK